MWLQRFACAVRRLHAAWARLVDAGTAAAIGRRPALVYMAVRSDDDPFLHQPRPGTPPVQPRVDATGAASPPPAHPALPRPTYWPVALAFGVTLLVWGLITTVLISIVGFLVICVAIGGWIGELLHEH